MCALRGGVLHGAVAAAGGGGGGTATNEEQTTNEYGALGSRFKDHTSKGIVAGATVKLKVQVINSQRHTTSSKKKVIQTA